MATQEKKVTPQILDRIFDKIAKENKAGTLLVSDGINEKCLYFTMTGLRMISNGNRKTGKIGQMLTAMEAINEEVLNEALFKQQKEGEQKKKKKSLLGEILEESQKVAHQEVVAAVRKQVENEIIDIYFWPEGVYEFTEGPAPAKFYDERFDSVVLNVTLRDFIEAVRQKINDFRKVTHPVKNVWNTFELTTSARERLDSGALKEHKHLELLKRIDGEKTVSQLSYGTIYSLFEMAKILSDLITEGLINMINKPAAGPVDFAVAIKSKPKKEIEKEMDDLAAAIDRAINDVLVHRRLAQSNEAINKPNEAAHHYRQVGEIQFKKENFDDSLEAFEKAKKMDPTDFSSQQKMMKIFEYKKLDEKMIEIGLELGKRFLDNGLFNKAKQLLLSLSAKKPENLEIRKQLLNSYVGLGDKESAKKEIEVIGNTLKKEGKQEEYVQLLQRMVDFQVADHTIRKALNSAVGRQLMWMVTVIVSLVGTMLLALLAYYYFNEYRSVAEYNTTTVRIQDLLYKHDYPGSLALIEQWYQKYPASSATEAANLLAQQIQARQHSYQLNYLQYKKAKAELEANPRERQKLFQNLLNEALWKETKDAKLVTEREELKRNLEALGEHIARFEKLLAHAESLRSTSPLECYEMIHRLLENYTDFPETKNLKVPFRVISNPAGATISLNQTPPVELGQTKTPPEDPLILNLSIRETLLLTAKLPGFDPITFDINRNTPHEILISFNKEPHWTFQTQGRLRNPITECYGMLYFTSSDGFLYALNGNNGRLLWKQPLGAIGACELPPLVYQNFLVLGTLSGELLCLNREDGKILARHVLNTPQIFSYIATEQGLIVIQNDRIVRYPLWKNPTDEPTLLRTNPEKYSCSPSNLGDVFVFGSGDTLHFFLKEDLTTIKTKRPINGLISGTPWLEAVGGNYDVYCLGVSGNFTPPTLFKYTMDKEWKHKLRWTWPNSNADKLLFVGDIRSKPISSPAPELNTLLIFATTDQHLIALDKNSKAGDKAWNYPLGGPVYADMTLNEDGKELYVPCLDQKVYLFQLTLEKPLLKKVFPIPAPIYSNVVLVQNQLIVAGYNGILYSFPR